VTDIGAAGRLLELAVTDLALIDRLRLELGEGLNVITGETGAGKSLLIDALGLALGARADTSLVRHGAETARVEALFDRLPEPVIAVREVAGSGRSTARLDDETVTAARLAEEVGPLVEIHGQHEQQRLLDERWQRDLLDAFGGHAALRDEMATAVERWRANRAALAELAIEPRELARRLELLEHEATEIEAARLRPGEADELRARLEAAQHGEAIARGAATLSSGRGAVPET
jgi:DNA repair protein RecN (Recombination protein N)